ncbi:MAG TPA: hypothetical protein VGL40_07200 [Bacillota bacterium]|jgi:hypothetical protein
MRRCLAYFLGHLINAARHLDADVLTEFARWSEEIGVTLPPALHPAAVDRRRGQGRGGQVTGPAGQ